MAWVVITAAFVVFCLLLFGAVQAARWWLSSAVESRPTKVVTINGTLQTHGTDGLPWTILPNETRLLDHASLRTDASSQALLTLFDYSTIVVSSGTELRLNRVGLGRFDREREIVEIDLRQGRIRLGVAPAITRQREFTVLTPGGAIALDDGSYTISSDGKTSSLRVAERGRAQLRSAGPLLALSAGQRVDWTSDGRTGSLQTAPEELVFNGDFSWGLQGWRSGNNLGFQEGQDHGGQVTLEPGSRGQPVVRFLRQSSKSTHAETWLVQEIERDVSDLSTLTLTATFRINNQSLSGGGYMGTEYPVIIRLNYRTATGEESFLFFGFYYQNTSGNRTDLGQEVPHQQWHTIPPVQLKSLVPQMTRVLSLQVSASGWDYDSQIESISISGR